MKKTETWLGMVHNNKFPPPRDSGKIWQDIFLPGMKSLNKYCSMCFTGEIKHYVASKDARLIKGSAKEKNERIV